MWGEPRPKCITFFLDGTAKVSDQYGRPIKGIVTTNSNKEVRFAQAPPQNDDLPGTRSNLATHAQVIAALTSEQINWQTLSRAGWPQLPYDELKAIPDLVPPSVLATQETFKSFENELRKIKDIPLRKDALRVLREANEASIEEARALEAE